MDLLALLDLLVAAVYLLVAWSALKLGNKVGPFRIARAWMFFSASSVFLAFHYLVDLLKHSSPDFRQYIQVGGKLWVFSNTIYLFAALFYLAAMWFLVDSFLSAEEVL